MPNFFGKHNIIQACFIYMYVYKKKGSYIASLVKSNIYDGDFEKNDGNLVCFDDQT